ncbi:hypothetical protein POTOM_049872 [Populus tomentosa]|uniref:Uncharacterized protein n=1 Tax=Populus tomentosa TaxID=118781 RepID=A0A8X7YFC9_POPTO|nr:hypothetical protein POTOM_049872 [Populus tomentosa]
MDSQNHHHHTIEEIDQEHSITVANVSNQPDPTTLQLKEETLTDPEESRELEGHDNNIRRINNGSSNSCLVVHQKKRKRPCNSDFVDLTEAAHQNSVSSGLAPIASTSPQGLVPLWPMGTFMFPQGSSVGVGGSNQAQFWAFPATSTTPFFNMAARPISSFVSAVQPGVQLAGNVGVGFGDAGGESLGSGGSPPNTIGSMSSSSSGSSTGGGGGGAQMLRDFSLEIYDKKELQFLSHPVNHDHQQAPCSES